MVKRKILMDGGKRYFKLAPDIGTGSPYYHTGNPAFQAGFLTRKGHVTLPG